MSAIDTIDTIDTINTMNPISTGSILKPELSVVIPIYNEEAGLQALFDRLYPALDKIGIPY